jgi:hypothetical protein
MDPSRRQASGCSCPVADPLEHQSIDTFPGARFGKKCQFCSKKDVNSYELQILSYTPRRRIGQFI